MQEVCRISTCSAWRRAVEGNRPYLSQRRQACQLTKLTQKQADYLGVPVEGPYKPDHYRY